MYNNQEFKTQVRKPHWSVGVAGETDHSVASMVRTMASGAHYLCTEGPEGDFHSCPVTMAVSEDSGYDQATSVFFHLEQVSVFPVTTTNGTSHIWVI